MFLDFLRGLPFMGGAAPSQFNFGQQAMQGATLRVPEARVGIGMPADPNAPDPKELAEQDKTKPIGDMSGLATRLGLGLLSSSLSQPQQNQVILPLIQSPVHRPDPSLFRGLLG